MTGNELSLVDEVRTMAANNQQLSAVAQQMGKLILSFDARFAALEKIVAQRMTVTSVQAKTITNAVQAQAKALCAKNGLCYQKHGEAFRRAIWRDFKAQYSITDVHDLPASYFDIALDFVKGWTSFAIVRRLRASSGA